MKIEKKHLSVPLTAQLEITDYCNHKCIHCYNLDSNIENRPKRKVTDDQVLACAQKLIDNQIFSVIITGGEPLIKQELTKKVITLFLDNDIKVSLNTNITLFTDDFIEFIRRLRINILTSCPSAIPTSYNKIIGVDNYDTFEKNLIRIIDSGVHITVNMVVTKENLTEIRTTAERMKKIGVRSLTVTPMGLNMDYPRLDLLLNIDEVQNVINDILWIENTLGLNTDILEALPKCLFSENILQEKHSFLNRKCQAGRTVIAVSSNGDVRPCAHNLNSYGNILEKNLKEIWAGMNDWRSSQYIPDECMECSWVNQCNGGCRTSAKTFTGNWKGKDMWAKSKLTLPIPTNKKNFILEDNTKLQINHQYKTRKESEDTVIIYNQKDNIFFMINSVFYGFILELEKYDIITLEELNIKYNQSENSKFTEIIYFLLQKNMLYIV